MAECGDLLAAANDVIDILYSTDTDLTGEQEGAVERLAWAAAKVELGVEDA